jgi:hypothetical protein
MLYESLWNPPKFLYCFQKSPLAVEKIMKFDQICIEIKAPPTLQKALHEKTDQILETLPRFQWKCKKCPTQHEISCRKKSSYFLLHHNSSQTRILNFVFCKQIEIKEFRWQFKSNFAKMDLIISFNAKTSGRDKLARKVLRWITGIWSILWFLFDFRLLQYSCRAIWASINEGKEFNLELIHSLKSLEYTLSSFRKCKSRGFWVLNLRGDNKSLPPLF